MKPVPVALKLSSALLAACLAPAAFASSALVISDITYLENGQPVIRPATATPEPATVSTDASAMVAAPATAPAAPSATDAAAAVIEPVNETVAAPAPVVPRIDPGPAVDKFAVKPAMPAVTTQTVTTRTTKSLPPVVKLTARNEGPSLVKAKPLNVPPPAASVALVENLVGAPVVKPVAAKSLGRLINGVPQIQQRFEARTFAEGGQTAANVQTSPAGIRYLSGGVGIDGRADIARVQGQFSVKLLSAIQTGELLTGVDIAIFTVDGRELLNVTGDGPVLLAELPAGEYIVRGTFADQAVQRWIKVVDGNLAIAYFRFDSRFSEGGLPPVK